MILSFRTASILLASFALTGCVSAYVPPSAGANTAILNATVHNLFGRAALDIDTGAMQQQNLLTTKTVGAAVYVDTRVSAPGDVRLVYEENAGSMECALKFKFQAEPDQTYQLFVGDVAPAAATTGLGKFAQWLFSMAGKGCFAKAWKTRADGSLGEIPLQRAFY